MATINGDGVPSKNTPGAVGDVYTDSSTGHKYKCTFSYRSAMDGIFDCEWKRIDEPNRKKPIPKRAQEAMATQNKDAEEKPVREKDMTVNTPRRKDYSAYSKRNK